jgi:hypothetical protein
MSGVTQGVYRQTLPCVNHADRNARSKCVRCGHGFCDDCLVFSVDGALWCEPCGFALADEIKPRWVLGGITLAVGFGVTTAIWVGKRMVLGGYPIPWFLTAIFLGYAGSALLAWRWATETTTGEKPRIERRVR